MEPADFQVMHEVIEAARRNLNEPDWNYLVGAAETETTSKRNRQALDTTAFRPRVLRDVSSVDLTRQFLGRRLRLPVLMAPIGSLEAFVEGGAGASARAAGAFGCPIMVSSVCEPGLEDVAAEAGETMRMFQLYARGDQGWIDDHVARAIAQGYAFALTVDSSYYSRRERDLAARYMSRSRRRATGHDYQAALSWRQVEHVKGRFDIPLILKGIATAEDARIALDHGVDIIHVSNHGGRQLDHGLGALDLLREVADAVEGRVPLIVDGGFYRGTDILKGLAVGADLVALGRLQGFGLAAGGVAGLVRTLELLEIEMRLSAGLLGITCLDELDRAYLCAAPSTGEPGWRSAFPLLGPGWAAKPDS